MIVLYRGYETKVIPAGFSWTTFFFGIFPALFRGDIFHAAFMFAINLVTLGCALLVWPFIYNEMHRTRLLKNGWSMTPSGSNGGGSGGGNGGGASMEVKKVPVYHEETLFSGGYDRSAPQYDILYARQDEAPASEPEQPPQQEVITAQPASVAIGTPMRKTFGRKIC